MNKKNHFDFKNSSLVHPFGIITLGSAKEERISQIS
jgi:hypothetical protein